MHQLALQIPEAAKAAGISRSTLYEEIRYGRLRAVKIGRSTRVRVEDLRNWLDGKPAIEPTPDGQRQGRNRPTG